MNTEISCSDPNINCSISLSGSKSIANRILIIKAISGLQFSIENLSESQDTILLQKALNEVNSAKNFDVNHAGTSFRFLTALLAITNGSFELTGSDRLKQRPVGELVEVLRKLGAELEFSEHSGFPPLKINGKKLTGGNLSIRGDISSQFITALLLIAPTFENGLSLTISTPLVSKPYVDMTVRLMRDFGITVNFEGNTLTVVPGNYEYSKSAYRIEGDWSSAGYWYEIAALSKTANIVLENLFEDSSQADQAVCGIFNQFGVQSIWENGTLRLIKQETPQLKDFEFDFTECPDAAQTVAATCAGLGVKATFTGLQTLKIKETDRILALHNELSKLGLEVQSNENSLSQNGKIKSTEDQISTYHDHRMALSFAPLALINGKIRVEDKNVIEKSYPAFWNDLQKAGFTIFYVD